MCKKYLSRSLRERVSLVQDIVEFQNDLIGLYLNSTITKYLSSSIHPYPTPHTYTIYTEEAVSTLYILSEIIQPLINIDFNYDSQNSEANKSNTTVIPFIFEESVIVNVLEVTEAMTVVMTSGDESISQETANIVVQILSNTVIIAHNICQQWPNNNRCCCDCF